MPGCVNGRSATKRKAIATMEEEEERDSWKDIATVEEERYLVAFVVLKWVNLIIWHCQVPSETHVTRATRHTNH